MNISSWILSEPGFIKIRVEGDPLSDLHRKLVIAAARTHLKTGLTICSHTGPAVLAFEELEFVWTHAQNEKEKSN
jgi:phosphotriesterase-related protein